MSLGRRLAEHKVSDLNGGTLAKSRRQDNGHTPLAITGIAQADVQVRLEVRELAKTGAQWNLFVLGMQKLQQMDQDERTSWYSISGECGGRTTGLDEVDVDSGNRNSWHAICALGWRRVKRIQQGRVLHTFVQPVFAMAQALHCPLGGKIDPVSLEERHS